MQPQQHWTQQSHPQWSQQQWPDQRQQHWGQQPPVGWPDTSAGAWHGQQQLVGIPPHPPVPPQSLPPQPTAPQPPPHDHSQQAHPPVSATVPTFASVASEPVANPFSAYNIPVGLLSTVLRRRRRRDPRSVAPFRPLELDELPTELPIKSDADPGVAEAVELFYSGGKPLTEKEKRHRERRKRRECDRDKRTQSSGSHT
eukprot:scaffold197354_cov30-Tisochrysis_lutea.AAC.1